MNFLFATIPLSSATRVARSSTIHLNWFIFVSYFHQYLEHMDKKYIYLHNFLSLTHCNVKYVKDITDTFFVKKFSYKYEIWQFNQVFEV